MTMYTLQLATQASAGAPVTFAPLGDAYSTRKNAMVAAKRLAGKGAHYWGDGLSIRYAGDHGTVYVMADGHHTLARAP